MSAKGPLHIIRMASITASLLALSMPAAAQIDQQSGIADPSRVGEQVERPNMAPTPAPNVTVRQAPPVSAPAGAESITFTLNGLNVEGTSVYSNDEIRALYSNKIGQVVSLADVYGIASQLTVKYRNDGYVLTQVVVPPQEIGNGVPTLRVVEGYIDQITVQKSSDMPVDMDNIQTYANQIARGGPMNVKDLERQLLIINDLPGVTAQSVISPSQTQPGAADLLIVLQYDPVDGLIGVNNFGSRYLGPVQVEGATTLNSMLGMNEAISAQVVMAPQSWYELAYGSLGYIQPVGPWGTKMYFNASVTDTDPGFNLKEFEVEGRSYFLNVGATHPFIRSRSQNLTGRVNLDWRRVRSANNIEDTRRDRITNLRFGGRYEFIDTIFGAGANVADLELSQGLGIFGASDEGDDNLSRADGDPQATKLEAEIRRLQRVTSNVNLLLGARGQVASDALLSSEEFSVGGINSGRGYDPSEVVGDKGLSGTLELQWNTPYSTGLNFIENYQLYGFYDIGRVWNIDPTTSSQKRDSVASTGFGVRLDLPMDVDAGFAVAFPLTRDVETKGTDGNSPTYYFNLSKRF